MTSSAAAEDRLDPRTPVLVGVGLIQQREDDPLVAAEPVELMVRATRAAAADAGAPALLGQLDQVLVPVGRWRYGNAAAMVAAAVGSPRAQTLCAHPGVSQQTILGAAASAIATGEITTALVVGGEAGYRLLRARIEGVEVHDTENDAVADVELRPDDEIVPAHERDRGLGYMPVGYYALIDSAWRHHRGLSLDEQRRRTAERYHRFSRIAATNPHGWDDAVVTADEISDARMMAFPYTKHHVSNWNVDQASALLLTSVGEANRLGVDRSRWVFPQAFTEANHIVAVSARGELHRSVGAELAAAALLDSAGCTVAEITFADIYTCFPVAVDIYAEALGLPETMDLTITGAMPFAGGPFNNYVLHATGQMAQRLRAAPNAARGLVTTVSGFLTKQGYAMWGTDANPGGYVSVDVTDATAAATDERVIDPDYAGPATVAAATVMYDRTGPTAGVVVLDLPDGRRSVARAAAPRSIEALMLEDVVGRTVDVDVDTFMLR